MDTKSAAKAEEERRKRIADRQKKVSSCVMQWHSLKDIFSIDDYLSETILSLVYGMPMHNITLYSCVCFYPTALKDCRGIVFTHGVRM